VRCRDSDCRSQRTWPPPAAPVPLLGEPDAFHHTFLGYLRRGLSREDLWLAVLVRHPTATQSELEIAAAASADVIRDEKRRQRAAAPLVR